ncbi:MAG TPA: hypothetical protein VHV55_04105 [Pirellulales bacterium]|jgi:hypothetical protein|nr:hypothetical protein [Pirellulales bacterium]
MAYTTWLFPVVVGGSLLAARVASADPVLLPALKPPTHAVQIVPAMPLRNREPAPVPDADGLEYPRTDGIPQSWPKGSSRSIEPGHTTGALSPELRNLRVRVRRTLHVYTGPRLNTRDHTPWELLHSIIAYGVQSEVREGGPEGRRLNAIGCLCYNFPCRGYRLLDVQEGRVAARKGVGVQGHPAQLLAILAQSHVPTDYGLQVGEQKFTVADLIESEKLSCETGVELTFKLISLAHYLDSDATWTNYQGHNWSIQRLIREEIKAPIVGAACGGTHRLMGLSYAVHKRAESGKPLTGEFERAKVYTDEFHAYTLKLQNSDGSFSTDWFRAAAATPDLGRRLQTTGHILEWLAYSLPENELTDPRIIRAVTYLSGMLMSDTNHAWEIGTLGHGIHALALYDERVFKPYDEAGDEPLATADEVQRLPGIAPRTTAPEPPAVSDSVSAQDTDSDPALEPARVQRSEAHRPWQLPRRKSAWQR